MQTEIKSPDGRHKAVLEIAGDIRFGPPYFSLKVDDRSFRKRVFGDACLWSGDSSFFAIQEWLTTSYEAGPQTALTLFDLPNHKECRVSWADRGFIVPISFEDNLLIYKKEYLGTGIIKEFEMDLRSLKRWKKIRRAW